jgi:WD40 repeat protein
MAGGTRLLTSSAADHRTVIRDATTLRPAAQFPGGGGPATVSADGRDVAFVAHDGSVRLLDLRTGRARTLGGRLSAPATAMRFIPGSPRLVTADGSGRLVVWDVKRATAVETLPGLAGKVAQLTIAPDGRTAYSAGRDGNVIGWDLAGTRRLGRPFRVGPPSPTGVPTVMAAGSTVAVPNDGGSVDLLDSRTLTPTRRISFGRPVPGADPMVIAVTPDGRTLAAGTRDGEVGFGDPRIGRLLGSPKLVHVGAVVAIAFSGDGRWLATSGDDHAVYIWDARRRRTVSLYAEASTATSLSMSPDASKLAATIVHHDGSGQLDIFSVPRLKLLVQRPATPGTQTQFSSDGRVLFYGDDAGRVWTLDTRTWKSRGRPVAGQANPGRFALTPDDHMLATTSSDGTTQLWDIPSGRPIGTALPGVANHPVSAAFVDGGTHLVTLQDTGRGYLWDVQPKSWAQRACAVAGRTLTRTEWHDALPERDYAPACEHP